mgnify:FL=1
MSDRTKRIASEAMLSAVSVLTLYLSSVMPTMRIGLAAIAGILPAYIVIRFGTAAGFICYTATSLLSLLLLPNKMTVLLYIILFGHYPMLKSLIERIGKLFLEWVLKLALFNVLLAVLLALSSLFFDASIIDGAFNLTLPVPVIYVAVFVAGNIVFVIYDIAFTGLIAAFLSRFKKL